MRDKLLKVVRILETDYAPCAEAEHDGSDCSSGCHHFLRLAGEARNDWVYAVTQIRRGPLLTFEHQGCEVFEAILLDRALQPPQFCPSLRYVGETVRLQPKVFASARVRKSYNLILLCRSLTINRDGALRTSVQMSFFTIRVL